MWIGIRGALQVKFNVWEGAAGHGCSPVNQLYFLLAPPALDGHDPEQYSTETNNYERQSLNIRAP